MTDPVPQKQMLVRLERAGRCVVFTGDFQLFCTFFLMVKLMGVGILL